MNAPSAIPACSGFGAVELKAVYQRNMLAALLAASLLAIGMGGTTSILTALNESARVPVEEKHPANRRDIWIGSIPLPPPVGNTVYTLKPAELSSNVRNATPVPVPDTEVSPDQTIARQDEWIPPVNPGPGGTGEGESGFDPKQGEADLVVQFHCVEIPPKVVRQFVPAYPEIARKTGIQGNVFAKVLVGKDGRVRMAAILKSECEIFDDAVLAAAKKWVFIPAIMNREPVSVWIAIPFRFRLSEGK